MEDFQVSDLITIKSMFRTYTVDFVKNFGKKIIDVILPGDVIIIDANVSKLYIDIFSSILENSKYIIIQPSEEQKSYQKLEWVIDELINKGFRKNNRLIAVGGGITQDITAFISSILFRGVDWIFFPTTLLAQCDSCIGSKTSINFGNNKNQIGNFWPPIEIYIDTEFLNTLSNEEIRSGFGEMLHYFMVDGKESFINFASIPFEDLYKKETIEKLIFRSLAIKKGYIEKDELDQGPRQVFNYGHSFGHALESITNYAIPHGIAVSFGMDISNCISVSLGLLDVAVRIEARKIFQRNWKGFDLSNIDVRAFEKALSKDKKNVGNELRVILSKGYGKMFKSPLIIDSIVSGLLDEWFSSWNVEINS